MSDLDTDISEGTPHQQPASQPELERYVSSAVSFVRSLCPTRRRFAEFGRSYGLSLAIHAGLLIILASIIWETRRSTTMPALNSRLLNQSETTQPMQELEIVPLSEDVESVDNNQPLPDLAAMKQLEVLASNPGNAPTQQIVPSANQLSRQNHPAAAYAGGGVSLDGILSVRADAAAYYGGTFASEEAVESALDWLVRHQRFDGSWGFDHSSVENCTCPNPGSHRGRTGATGIALLAFFGAGYNHADGRYADSVYKALRFLLAKLNTRSDTSSDLFDGDTGHGGIYQHGMATAALAEALAINRALLLMMKQDPGTTFTGGTNAPASLSDLERFDEELKQACQRTVNYIIEHQDKSGGGWGYSYEASGDTSILGWQLMALTTARAEQIEIPRKTWSLADNFLDSVVSGFGYSYRPKENEKVSTTAIGALCRFWASPGFKRVRLKNSIQKVLDHGPSKRDMYYNYYATQSLFAWGDEKASDGEKLWSQWNQQTRDLLISLQSHDDHAKGSWYLGSRSEAGRHFDTCLAALTLEVYYRKLPAFQRLAVEAPEFK